jgi:hypothetical protein
MPHATEKRSSSGKQYFNNEDLKKAVTKYHQFMETYDQLPTAAKLIKRMNLEEVQGKMAEAELKKKMEEAGFEMDG